MAAEFEASQPAMSDKIGIPNPPSSTGKANNFLTTLLMFCLPVYYILSIIIIMCRDRNDVIINSKAANNQRKIFN